MNRYRVAVCDDDVEELNDLCNKISRLLDDNDADYTIDRFISGKSLIDAVVGQKMKYDILFLDILMAEVNGIMAAQKIREQDEGVSLVFITNSPDFVFAGYDVQALHYILKPVEAEKLAQTLLYDWHRRNEKNYLDVKLSHAVCRIIFDDICYLESRGRKIRIRTKNGDYETYGTLSRFMEILPAKQFISCHKSYAANLNYVSQITKTCFTTIDNQTIPISKSCYSEAKKAFINFIGNRN